MKQYNKVRKIMVDINECVNLNKPNHPGLFTRGDGSKYKEWPYIKCDDTDSIWKKMLTLSPSKILYVSGEFGSSSYNSAMILNGILFVKYGCKIEFGDPSRLRNTSVWRSKEYI